MSKASAALFPDARIINGSSTDSVAVLTVVVSPLTVKSPPTVRSLVTATAPLALRVIPPASDNRVIDPAPEP